MDKRVRTSGEVAGELKAELAAARAHPNEIFGYAHLGERWPQLNKMTAGLHKRRYMVLASQPKVGKSMLSAGWLPALGEQALSVGEVLKVVSLEMPAVAYMRRAAAVISGVQDPMTVRSGLIPDDEAQRYNEVLEWLAYLPIEFLSNEIELDEEEAMIPGASNITFDDVRAFIRGKETGKTFFWLLDHLQLLSDVNADGDIVRSVYSLSKKVAYLCHTSATGLIITHLTREQHGSTPTLESIGGSYQVAKDADTALLLTRPFFGNTSPEDRELIKNGEPAFLNVYAREERSGVVVMWWDVRRASFSEAILEEGVPLPMPGDNKKKKK